MGDGALRLGVTTRVLVVTTSGPSCVREHWSIVGILRRGFEPVLTPHG